MVFDLPNCSRRQLLRRVTDNSRFLLRQRLSGIEQRPETPAWPSDFAVDAGRSMRRSNPVLDHGRALGGMLGSTRPRIHPSIEGCAVPECGVAFATLTLSLTKDEEHSRASIPLKLKQPWLQS